MFLQITLFKKHLNEQYICYSITEPNKLSRFIRICLGCLFKIKLFFLIYYISHYIYLNPKLSKESTRDIHFKDTMVVTVKIKSAKNCTTFWKFSEISLRIKTFAWQIYNFLNFAAISFLVLLYQHHNKKYRGAFYYYYYYFGLALLSLYKKPILWFS